MVFTSYTIGYVKQTVENALVVLSLNHYCEDVFQNRGQFSEFGVVELYLGVEAALKFIQKVVSPSHVFQDECSGLFKAFVLFVEIGTIGEQINELIDDFLFPLIDLMRHQTTYICSFSIFKNNKFPQSLPHLIFDL